MATGPYSPDLLVNVVNVHWGGGGVFSFAGNIIFQIETYLPDVGDPDDLQLSWLGGTSKDGESWKSGGPSQTGLALFCCVRGKVSVTVGGKVEEKVATVAAGAVPVNDWYGPGYARNFGLEPAAGISYDDGQNWSDAGIPVQQFTLKPANPHTGEAADVAEGNSNAVAYHPPTQTFYVGASVSFFVGADKYWEDRMYSWSGEGFSEVYSERREWSAPFPGFRWPTIEVTPDIKPSDRLRVADRTGTTPPGPGTVFVTSFISGQHAEYVNKEGKETYVSVNSSRTGVTLGGVDISQPMPSVNSVCGGMGHIVVVGWEDEDQLKGPVTYVSDDDGKSWKPQLLELKHTNPGREDKDGGSSAGSCSFSPD